MKKPLKIKTRTPLLVIWEDATEHGGWFDPEEISCQNCHYSPGIVTQVGMYVKHDKDRLTLTSGFNSFDSCMSIHTIPLGCIKKIIRLTSKRK